MNIELHEITVRDLVAGYEDRGGEGGCNQDGLHRTGGHVAGW